MERTHSDIYSGVLCVLARTFAFLEDNGLLDPVNELHLFVLHYISSTGNRSPLEMYTAGMLENEHSGYAGVADVFDPNRIHD